MTINYSLIGNRIKAARKAKGLSQSELSELIDRSVGYMSYIETGRKKANIYRNEKRAPYRALFFSACNIHKIACYSLGINLLAVWSSDNLHCIAVIRFGYLPAKQLRKPQVSA